MKSKEKFSNDVHFVVNTLTEKMVKWIQQNLHEKFELRSVRVRTKSRTRTGLSLGGTFGIYINVAHLYYNWNCNAKTTFYEYSHIKNRNDIGSIHNISWQKYVCTLLAHEIAHALEYYEISDENPVSKLCKNFVMSDPKPFSVRGHGKIWQFIYAKLRKEFVDGWKEDIEIPTKKTNSMDISITKKYGVTYYFCNKSGFCFGVRKWNLLQFRTEEGKFEKNVCEYRDGREARKIANKFYKENFK